MVWASGDTTREEVPADGANVRQTRRARRVAEVLARVLTATAGAFLVSQSTPIAIASWLGLGAESPLDEIRFGRLPPVQEVASAAATFERAIEWEDTARRRADLATLLVVNATRRDVTVADIERSDGLAKAELHLTAALARTPADGAGWLRLALVRETLYGLGEKTTKALVMSIRTAPAASGLWPTRLELLLRSVGHLSAQEVEISSGQIALIWQSSRNRTLFALAINAQGGELFVRYALRDIDGAQEELSKLLRPAQ